MQPTRLSDIVEIGLYGEHLSTPRVKCMEQVTSWGGIWIAFRNCMREKDLYQTKTCSYASSLIRDLQKEVWYNEQSVAMSQNIQLSSQFTEAVSR